MLCRVVVAGLLFLGPMGAFGADALGVWHRRSPLPTAETLNGIAYGNGCFVAVGDNGTLLSSSNAVDWVVTDAAVTNHLNTAFFAEGRFLVGGEAGTILWSENGLAWTNASVPMVQGVTAFGFGRGTNAPDGLFVALASVPQFSSVLPRTVQLVSADGITWRTDDHTSFGGRGFSCIAFCNERFVASGGLERTAAAGALYSDDGTNWSIVAGSPFGPLVFGNGLFVITLFFPATNEVTVLSVASADGSSWPDPSFSASGFFPQGLCFGGGRYVTVGGPGCVGVSPDGTNWVTGPPVTDAQLRAVAYGDGQYVAVGAAGVIVASSDGTNWTSRNAGTGRHLLAVAPAEDGFVAVGMGGSVTWSTNGIFWQRLTAPTTNALLGVREAAGRMVVVGGSGTILSGDGPTNLAVQASGTTRSLACVGFAHGTWLAAGEAGTILLSLNTVDWVLQDGATINRLASMAYGNGLFVAVGDNGAIVTSSDGVYWSVSDSRTTRSLVAVEFGNGRFVAVAGRVGVQGLAVSSLDGTNWVASSTPLMGITGVAFGVGRFVSPAQGRVYSSADGREWSEHDLVGDRPAAGPLAYNNGTFVSAGLYGVILQSDPSVRLAASFDGSLRLSIEGPKNQVYRIDSRDAFDDSASWEEVTTLPAGPYLWTGPGPLSSATRYYRAVLLPVQ